MVNELQKLYEHRQEQMYQRLQAAFADYQHRVELAKREYVHSMDRDTSSDEEERDYRSRHPRLSDEAIRQRHGQDVLVSTLADGEDASSSRIWLLFFFRELSLNQGEVCT